MQSDPGPNLCRSAPPDTKSHYWKVIMKRFLHIWTMILNPKQEFNRANSVSQKKTSLGTVSQRAPIMFEF